MDNVYCHASKNDVGITQQMCHITILFHDCSLMKDKSTVMNNLIIDPLVAKCAVM